MYLQDHHNPLQNNLLHLHLPIAKFQIAKNALKVIKMNARLARTVSIWKRMNVKHVLSIIALNVIVLPALNVKQTEILTMIVNVSVAIKGMIARLV